MSQSSSVLQLPLMSANVGTLEGTELRKRTQSADARTNTSTALPSSAAQNGYERILDDVDADIDLLQGDLEPLLSECAPLARHRPKAAQAAMSAPTTSSNTITNSTCEAASSHTSGALTLATTAPTKSAVPQPYLGSKRGSRSFSESSADELHRSGEAIKRAGWNKKMWRNELVVNPGNNTPQPQRRSNCCCAIGDGGGIGGGDGICCCGRGKICGNRISDVIDVGIRVVLVIAFGIMEQTNSFHRKIHKEEMWLYMNPRTPDIVTPATLLLSVIFGPFLVTLLYLQMTQDRRDFRAANWVWTLALGLNGLFTSLLKITVGRHRPDFFYRCFPDGVAVFNNASDPFGRADIFNCTGNESVINEGRKSFPSGHASFAFVGFGFIAIYIGAKLHAFSPRGRGQTWRLLITILPLVLAMLIAVSRTCDYHHHWEDVVAGGFIGLTVTYLVYRQYYPSLWSHNCHRPYARIGITSMTHNNYRQRSNSYRRLSSDVGDSERMLVDPERDMFHSELYDEDYHKAAKDEQRPLIYDG